MSVEREIMESLSLGLLVVVSGFVWLRIFADPLNRLLARFINDRLIRLIVTAGILLVIFSAVQVVIVRAYLAEREMPDAVMACVVGTVPCAILWVTIEYRYGGSYRDRRRRLNPSGGSLSDRTNGPNPPAGGRR